MSNIGILDPKGININPLNNKNYSEEYKNLSKIWSKFPAYEKANYIIETIKKNQVTIVISGTGSGKTVLVPKFALHALDYKKKIAITLPKQIITKSAAEFSAKTLDVELGNEVGYKYRGSPKNSKSNNNKLLYATDGTIVAKLLNDPSLKEFDMVIVDEAHERKVQIDFLLYLLKQTLKLRPDFKLIIMSATINSEIFTSYYKEFKLENINITGKTNYPIESIFLEKDIDKKNYIQKGLDIIIKIIKEDDLSKKGSHDIMFFVTSSNEAFDLCKELNNIIESDNSLKKDVYCIEVFAGMNKEKQIIAQDKELFKKEGEFNRKIVITTNVAESSLTIEGIKYVIDSGYELLGQYDPDIMGHRLQKEIISHAQAKQRMGRSGRTEPGVCYHLYTEDFFNKMKKFPEPDIRKQDITDECLKLLNVDSVQTVPNLLKILTDFIEPPREQFIYIALQNLSKVKAVSDQKITEFGRLLIPLNMDYKFAISILVSKMYRCTFELIDIYSIINTIKSNLSDIFRTPQNILKGNSDLQENKKELKKQTDRLNKKLLKSQKKFHHKTGDHISLLRLFNSYKKKHDKQSIDDWCYKNFIKKEKMQKIHKYAKRINRNIFNYIKNIKISDFINFNPRINNLKLEYKIIYCLLIGFKYHTGVLKKDKYKTDYTDNIDLDKICFLNLNKKPSKSVIYNLIFVTETIKKFNIVSEIPNEIKKVYNL